MKSEMEGLMAEPIKIGGKASSKPDCIIYSTPASRNAKLKELTIAEELLVDALQRGVAEKLTAEIFDPATAGGYDLYRYTTRYVRKGLYEAGWELSDSNNIALVRDPAEGTVIIVCSGDHQTGQLVGDQPKTKRSKGDLFLEVSEIVATDLFGDDEVKTRHVALPDAKVWLLLHYHVVDRGQQILRAELSRPLEANDGMITQWSERVILHVPLPDAMADDESANDEGPVITPDVEIRF